MRLLSSPAGCNGQLIDDALIQDEITQIARNDGIRALSDADDFFSLDLNKREPITQPLDVRSENTSASSLFEISEQDVKYNSDAPSFVPFSDQTQQIVFDSDIKPFEPSYRQKEKTEICKNWLRGLCRYGAMCAFAHG